MNMSTNKLACLNQVSTFLQQPISKLVLNNEKIPTCIVQDKTLTGFVNIILTLVKYSKEQTLTDANPELKAEIEQWLEYCVTCIPYINSSQNINQVLQEIDTYLLTRTYFVGFCPTIVDITMFYVLHSTVENLSYLEKEKYLNVSRWYDNIQQNNKVRANKSLIDFSIILLSSINN